MKLPPAFIRSCVLPVLFIASMQAAENAATPGDLRSYSTIHSIGVEWDLTGDANHNATCQVHYRAPGATAWKEALPLFRIDYSGWYADQKADRPYNMMAGSVLFLEPGRVYEVKLDLADPDGGSRQKNLNITTRALPSWPAEGRTFHVVPDGENGDGSPGKPFAGLAIAQAAARPGDTFLLHHGNYGSFDFKANGEPGRYLVWRAAGDGEAVLAGAQVNGAAHVWFQGLRFQTESGGTGLHGQSVEDLVVTRCHFTGFHYSIMLNKQSRGCYIADNEMVGDNDPAKSNISGEGVELAHSSDNDVCYNRISRVADGVSYGHRNCDIYGNDIFDVTDDGLEMDYGYANLRLWDNRITNAHNSGLSFQPMFCGPWYFIRNQIVCQGYLFKFRVQDRFVLVNNTFVAWGFMDKRMHHILSALTRNNLFISAGTREGAKLPVWTANQTPPDSKGAKSSQPDKFDPDWRTDVDYDGFDWAEAKDAFRWQAVNYPDLAAFSAALGIEKHGLRVKAREIFERFDVPAEKGRVEVQDFMLKAGGLAVDAGVRLPNLAEVFAGSAPDLGAHEHGLPPTHYGPRPEK